jgi:hypothetical protein
VRQRKGASDLSRLSQGVIIIQKQVSISRRSRSHPTAAGHQKPGAEEGGTTEGACSTARNHRSKTSNAPGAYAHDLRGLQDHRILYEVGFGIRKSRAARDAARAFVGLHDRRADGHTLHAKACCEREATGRARERAKRKPCFLYATTSGT